MKHILFSLTLSLLSLSAFSQFELEANYSMMSPRSNFKTFHNAQDGSGINILGRVHREEKKGRIEFGLGFWGFTHNEAIGYSQYTNQISDNYKIPIQVQNYNNDGTAMASLMFGYMYEEKFTENWSIGGGGRVLGYLLLMPNIDYTLLQPSPDGVYTSIDFSHDASATADLGLMPQVFLKRKFAKNFHGIVRGSWLITSSLFSDLEYDEDITISYNDGLPPETESRTNTVNLSSLNISVGLSYTFGNKNAE